MLCSDASSVKLVVKIRDLLMTFRRPLSLDTFVPKINGGVPTKALGDALTRDKLKQAAELLQSAAAKPRPAKPSEGK